LELSETANTAESFRSNNAITNYQNKTKLDTGRCVAVFQDIARWAAHMYLANTAGSL